MADVADGEKKEAEGSPGCALAVLAVAAVIIFFVGKACVSFWATDPDASGYEQYDTTTCQALRFKELDNSASDGDRIKAQVAYEMHCQG